MWPVILSIVVVCLSGVINGNGDSEPETDIFLRQPPSGPVYVPINSTASFNCTVANNDLIWTVEIQDDGKTVSIDFNDDIRAQAPLNMRGITRDTLTTQTMATSLLNIEARAENNLTKFRCTTFIASSLTVLTGNKTTLIVYDYPNTPENVVISDVSIQTVNVSWDSQGIPGVELIFTLTVVNSNRTSQMFNVTQPHFVFTASKDSHVCDLYQFQISATNEAGSSGVGENEPTMLPSLPRVSSLDESLQHVVKKVNSHILITLTFNVADTCAEYPVTHYHISISTRSLSQPAMTISILPPLSAEEELTIILFPEHGVLENMLYTYYIIATNDVGNVSSGSKECYTSDLQGIMAVVVNEDQVDIECQFIEGSNARGCLVVLVSTTPDAENITTMLYRANNDLVTQRTLQANNITSQYHLFGFDIESDDTISDLAVPGEISLNCSQTMVSTCFPTEVEPSLEPQRLDTVLIATVVASVVVVLLLGLLLLLVITIVVLRRKTALLNESSTVTEEMKINLAYGVVQNKHQRRQINTNAQVLDSDILPSMPEGGRTAKTSTSNLPAYEEIDLEQRGDSINAPVIYDRVIPDHDGVMLQGNASYKVVASKY